MIYVLGSINIDYCCALDHLPGAGETVLANGLVLTPGGKGANQALAAKRAGAIVKMSGMIGSDDVADQALTLLRKSSVDLTEVTKVPGPTGCAFVFVDADGENQIVVVPGANALVSADRVGDLAFEKGDILLLQLEIPPAAVIAAATHAKSCGATVVANLAPYSEQIANACDNFDIIIVNETEAQQLADDLGISNQPDPNQQLANQLQSTVVKTSGAKGVSCYEHSASTPFTIPALEVSVVDTVGAGDTFAGYLCAMLERGRSLRNACKIANAAAALACTKEGAQTAIPTINELQARIGEGFA